MWLTVLQTTAIYTTSHILNYHTSENLFRVVWENPTVLNLTAITKNTTIASNVTTSRSATTPTNSFSYEKDGVPIDQATADRLIGEAFEGTGKGSDKQVELPLKITLKNGTVLNETISVPKAQEGPKKQQESFYKKKLPLDIVAYFIMCTLQYCWLLGLERALPARSRRRDVVVTQKGEMDEDREEEVVKKWIAQGRVRRASLNWCNTLFKWILTLTVGRVWYYAVLHVVCGSLRLTSPRKTWEDMFQVSRACLILPLTARLMTHLVGRRIQHCGILLLHNPSG